MVERLGKNMIAAPMAAILIIVGCSDAVAPRPAVIRGGGVLLNR